MPHLPEQPPRSRYLIVSNHPVPKTAHDQKTIRDTRAPGAQSQTPIKQYKSVPLYRKIDSKKFPLRQGMPYVPLIVGIKTRGAINVFDPNYHTLQDSLHANYPYNSAFRVNHNSPFALKHSQMQALKMTNTYNKSTQQQYHQWLVSGNIQDKEFIQNKGISAPLYYDKNDHRHKIRKHGIVDKNALQMAEHIKTVISDVLKK